MIIKNVSLNDDSTFGPLGRYECHAFAVGDPVERKHGFSVNVVRSKSFSSRKLSMLLRFYFHVVLEKLKTNVQKIFASKELLVS